MASEYPRAGHARQQTRLNNFNCLQWFASDVDAIMTARYSR
jgi:hypothetical protein